MHQLTTDKQRVRRYCVLVRSQFRNEGQAASLALMKPRHLSTPERPTLLSRPVNRLAPSLRSHREKIGCVGCLALLGFGPALSMTQQELTRPHEMEPEVAPDCSIWPVGISATIRNHLSPAVGDGGRTGTRAIGRPGIRVSSSKPFGMRSLPRQGVTR